MINVDNANAYFSEHTQGAQWGEYSVGQRKTAIAQAKRDLARAIGRPMNEDEGVYAPGTRQRDEYAVYEQALYLLLRNAHPQGIASATPSLNPDEAQESRTIHSVGNSPWSVVALTWLGSSVRVELKMS